MNNTDVLARLESSRPIVVKPDVAVAIGLNEAILLQQLAYWLERSANVKDGQRWVWKTYDDWAEELPFFSLSTIKRIVKKLRQAGLVETSGKYNKMPTDQTLWYTIPGWSTPAEKPERRAQRAGKKEKQEDQGSEHKAMMDAIAWVLHGTKPGDPVANKLVPWSRIAGHAKQAREAGATTDDLKEWYRDIWPKHWAYNNGKRPTWNIVRNGLIEMLANTVELEPEEEVLDL